jgi:dihydroorotate dehydrogenase (fumarate)
MNKLATNYLGLDLKNPLVPSASPLSKDLAHAKRLQDAGASALIMYSLFEEKIAAEQQHLLRFFYEQSLGHAEADSFHPVPDHVKSYFDGYLDQLYSLKQGLEIPVIASLNGTTLGGWIEYAHHLEQAGADALELNIYHLPTDAEQSSNSIEHHYLQIVGAIRQEISIPLTVKLSPQFSSPLHFIKALESAGANGISLFNRFYQADIDLETLNIVPKLELSTVAEALLRIRWTALLYGQTKMSLAVTGGFHQTPETIKALLAGADVVHYCSALLLAGPGRLSSILQELALWLEEHEYESIQQLKGSVSYKNAINPSAYERANYLEVLDSYTPSPGVWR